MRIRRMALTLPDHERVPYGGFEGVMRQGFGLCRLKGIALPDLAAATPPVSSHKV